MVREVGTIRRPTFTQAKCVRSAPASRRPTLEREILHARPCGTAIPVHQGFDNGYDGVAMRKQPTRDDVSQTRAQCGAEHRCAGTQKNRAAEGVAQASDWDAGQPIVQPFHRRYEC
jgi:hypothetical protein